MAYTPIEWDETIPVNPTNLNKMDEQIDANEDDISNIIDGSTINTLLENAIFGNVQTQEVPEESTASFNDGSGLYYFVNLGESIKLKINSYEYQTPGIYLIPKGENISLVIGTLELSDDADVEYIKITFSN